ncbi:TolC family protein, partial [candidate division KSB1 bacterium]|nr:TolC family protein [candidate division KSB1 bacterium]
ELEFLDDQVELIDNISRDYYSLFNFSYTDIILERHIRNLEQVKEIINCPEQNNGSKSIDCIQIQVELTNLMEKRAQNMSDFRLQANRVKQRLGLDESDTLEIIPEIKITEIKVDLKQAIQYGHTLRPRMRLLDISRRKNEIDLTNVKGWNSFRMDVEMTYGLEKQDETRTQLWNEFDNSYSVTVNAYVPIWDWGQRKARIAAQEMTIRKTELYQEETRSRIESEIKSAYQNLQEYQQRTLNMQENMMMAEEITGLSIDQYAGGEISLRDLLQTLTRQKETEENFLEAYLGYRKSIIGLTIDTYYDYENDIALLEKFRSAS